MRENDEVSYEMCFIFMKLCWYSYLVFNLDDCNKWCTETGLSDSLWDKIWKLNEYFLWDKGGNFLGIFRPIKPNWKSTRILVQFAYRKWRIYISI
jgi:hypothetical protein